MAISLTEILAAARIDLADDTTTSTYWDDDDLTKFANDACRELIHILPKQYIAEYQEEGIYALNTSGYISLPSDFSVEDAVYCDSNRARMITKDLYTEMLYNNLLKPTVGQPIYWIEESGVLHYRPIPSEEIASGLLLYYIKEHTDLEDGADEVELHPKFLPVLSLLLSSKAKSMRESAEDGKQLHDLAFEQLKLIIGKRTALEGD